MTTSCTRSTLEPERRLMKQGSMHYQKHDEEEDEVFCAENQEDKQVKKPRRKDTPVLHSPPHVPGVRTLKTEKQLVHSEDEEKEGKD